MLMKRIIPCLDVKNNQVIKGVQFRQHQVVGDIMALAKKYSQEGADELVFYDITASSDQRVVDRRWVNKVAAVINIPFCVAGGISSIQEAEVVLNAGADKISINSPAIAKPDLINQLVKVFGQQCVVVGIDSFFYEDQYCVYQYTGMESKTRSTGMNTADWVKEVQDRGAGEIVLNCMNQDGVRKGYDIEQLKRIRDLMHIPLVASGGAGKREHFYDVFQQADVDGALAASVFHKEILSISTLKTYLRKKNLEVRV